MTKLNQILPIIKDRQADAETARTKVHQALQKADPITGLVKTYKPKADETENPETLPGERKLVQLTVPVALEYAFEPWQRLMDIVLQRDATNREAVADIVVNGATIAREIPTTYLMWLEKELIHLHTLISKLPRLDPAKNWTYDEARGFYVSEAEETTRSEKIPRAFVKYHATDKHPAQVEMYNESQVVGTWTKQDFSGAIPAEEADALLYRVRDLQEAVKKAIFEANAVEIQTTANIGAQVLGYVMSAAQTPFAAAKGGAQADS